MSDTLEQRVVRVLLIEDNPHVADLIREGLDGAARREFGGKVAFIFEVVSDGQAGLIRLEQDPVDLIICDVYMPVMDGATFLTHFRKRQTGTRTPVIALSAGGLPAREAAIEAGADIFLDKPIRLHKLLEAAQSLLKP